jgi:23S rRNA (guanosine2251-2'-O)-methyltransferase
MNNIHNKQDIYYLFGKHSCIEALTNPRRKIIKIYTSEKNFDLIPKEFESKTEIVPPSKFASLIPEEQNHQGIIIKTKTLETYNFNSLNCDNMNNILILDQITDPHNYGSILRIAASFEADLVITTKNHSSAENGIVAKVSVGALEKLKICEVTNLASALKTLKDKGFWVIGLDGNAKEHISTKIFSGKTCLVMGAEGKGIRRLTKDNCDVLAKIPMSAKMESLNVASATSIAMYKAYIAKNFYNDKIQNKNKTT